MCTYRTVNAAHYLKPTAKYICLPKSFALLCYTFCIYSKTLHSYLIMYSTCKATKFKLHAFNLKGSKDTTKDIKLSKLNL